jgi:HD-GYP domain-containing protein (c-di-GMP phosphodiesterase class II)
MSADRPYRAAFPKKIAIQRLKESSGIQFDPDLLKIFLKIIQKVGKKKS